MYVGSDDLGLVPIFKTNQKTVIFMFFFDLFADIILKQLNILKTIAS